MKRIFIISTLFIVLLSACGATPAPVASTPAMESLPVLKVDSQHMLTPDLYYEIPAGAGFTLDATGYDFGVAGGPTSVQVMIQSRIYQTDWAAGALTQTILASSLIPLAGSGSPKLTDFPAGKQFIVSIGTIKSNGRFSPIWVSVINVR